MPIGYIRALALLHHTFKRHPAGQRAHILGRFFSAPFLRTLDSVPDGARVLDVGAGHGTFARLLAEERGRSVVALEPDLRKSLRGFRHPNVRWVAGFDDSIRGAFDAVVLYDVLYRIAPEERDPLFRRVHALLAPGGVLLLKDIDPEHRMKWRWNRLQETVSDGLFRLTIGEGLHPETSDAIRARLERAGFTEFAARDVGSWYPHAHVIYTARKR